MGDTLGRVNRAGDIVRALEQIAGYLDQRQVDVMLVTGDVFSDRLHQEQIRAAIAEIKRIFTPFLRRGGTILAISGNHDSEIFFETLRDALDLVISDTEANRGGQSTGRLYLAPNPRVVSLTDAQGLTVQFVMMPYPTPRCYLRGEKAGYRTLEEKHRAIQQRFVETLQHLKTKVDLRHPAILMSHVFVRGASLHTAFRMSEGEDVLFEPSDIPAEYAYVAYGHIHKPQEAVVGAPHIRYAGSIERMDYAERDDNKSVVLVEVNSAGRVAEPELLPLESTPFYRVEVRDPDAELPTLTERFKDNQPERALVLYTLRYDPARHDPDAAARRIEAIFPRWYQREWIPIQTADSPEDNFAPCLHDVAGTVRDYLHMRLAAHERREELLTLTESLLAEEDWQ
jgi:exonuclease SbcD